jgi:hypothetical protein
VDGAEPALESAALSLADAAEAALPGWVERQVERLMLAWKGEVPDVAREAARAAGRQAQEEIGGRLRTLLALDVDQQRTNPLSVLRGAVAYPAAVLRAAGVPEVVRDPFKEQAFPADVYDLVPATWTDIDPSVHEPGVVWSAWKAGEHLRRRRRGEPPTS